MKTLATLKEQDINPQAPIVDSGGFRQRQAARAVVFDAQGRVALLNVGRKGYHKLPGGGVDAGEDLAEALERELLEEIGCKVEVVGEVGKILEYWDEERQLQTSYCYIAKQVGDRQSPAFTREEQDDGFQILWATSLDEAITILAADQPKTHDGLHIKPRDLLFLKTAKAKLQL